MDSRWAVLIVACLVVVGVAVGAAFLAREPAPVEVPDGPPAKEVDAARQLVNERRFKDALVKLEPLLSMAPERPDLNYLMGLCLYHMSRYERSLSHLQIAEGDRQFREICRFPIGTILARIDRPDMALPLLEVPLKGEQIAADEADRILRLAGCYMDLEQFKDALDLLQDQPEGPAVVRTRVKALRYLDRAEEADRILENLAGVAQDNPGLRAEIGYLRAVALREKGDFAGAFKAFKEIRETLSGHPAGILFMDRVELALLVEAGEGERLEKAASDLASRARGKWQGDALWYRAVAQLLAGRREDALGTAGEFLDTVDLDFSPLRHEILMMRQLAGEVDAAAVEKEAKQISRFRANVLYFFLALSTGDRIWAERARAVTPGHNFPYHSIGRLLDK